MKYEYDSDGVYFFYFLWSIFGLWVLPTTYFSYVRPRLFPAPEDHKTDKDFTGYQFKSADTQPAFRIFHDEKAARSNKISRRAISLIIGWVVFALLSNRILTSGAVTPVKEAFDPYRILELDVGAAEEVIKKQFKVLSRQYHPDKATDEQSRAEMEERFIKLSKAYKALTDEDVRKNWEEYGDPDGRQAFSYGIALPTWIVDPSNKAIVLTVYALLFGVLLPVVVGRWWSRSKRYTKDRVLNQTMAIFFQELKEAFNTRRMLELLCASAEFKDEVPWRGQRDANAMMELFKQVRERVQDKTGERLELPKKYSAAYCHKAFILVHAHLFRVPIADPLLLADSQYIIPKMVHLALRGLLGITAAQYWFMPSVQCLELSKMILQAVPSTWAHTDSSELHQLPHMGTEQIKTLRAKKKQLKSVYQLLALPAEERTALLKGVQLGEDQISDLLTVARRIPKISIISAEFVCMGEDSITPESLVTLVVRLRAITYDQPINALKVPDAYADDAADDEEDMGNEDDDERTGRMSKLTKLLSGSYWLNPNDPIHCPYFPQAESEEQLKRPTYWLWLAAPRNNRVVGPPVRINKLVPVSVDETDPKKGVKTVKFSFMAPQSPGIFSFTVFVDGDTYLGMEASQDVKLVVRPIAQAELEQRNKQARDAWKDFDEDEELMAGQNPFSLGGAVSTGTGDNDDSSSDSDSSSSSDSSDSD